MFQQMGVFTTVPKSREESVAIEGQAENSIIKEQKWA
jgi:hypothetical protein